MVVIPSERRPVAKERHQLGLFSRVGDSVRSLSRVQRELIFLSISLVLGLFVIPAAIFLVGSAVLGPYAGGGNLAALLKNFYKALGDGAPSFWLVAAGPYVLIQLLRLLVFMLWGKPPAERTEAAPQPRRAPPAEGRRVAPTIGGAPQPRRAPPQTPAPQQPRRPAPTSNVRKTPTIKSID
jgi:hypothetical protein